MLRNLYFRKNSKYIDEDDDDDCEMVMDNSRDTISESDEEQVNLPTPPRLLVASKFHHLLIILHRY